MQRSCGIPDGLRRAAAFLGAMVVAIASSAEACNVPVFRYALEHWRPDPYRGALLHRGPLTEAERDRFAALQERAQQAFANLALRTVDLDAAPATDSTLLGTVASNELPQLALQYPAHLKNDRPIWIGGLDDTGTSMLFDSPLRRELLQRLTAGQSAVWVMVDSGDESQDSAAAATLERELSKLPQTLKLPVLTDAPEDAIQDGPALRVEFSLLRIRRDDANEQALAAMLLGCEPDLAELREPIVFPIFGRCRALLPLVGAGIAPDNIRSAAAFLSGACSCQVKELNPGFDLLMTANWKNLLSWAKTPATTNGGSAASASVEPELVAIPQGAKNAPAKPATTSSGPSAAAPRPAAKKTNISDTPQAGTMSAGEAVWALLALAIVLGMFLGARRL